MFFLKRSQNWTAKLKFSWSTDSNDVGAIKSGSIIAPRGFRFSRILKGKAENFKAKRCSAVYSAGIELCTYRCGVRSFLVEVEELPAVRRWDVLPAHSESRRGRNMKRTFSPSLPPSIRPRSSPNPGPFSVPCVLRAGVMSSLPFIHSFPLPNHQKRDRNVYVLCVGSV